MAGDEFRVGDVVRVTLEGKVTRVLPALGGHGAVELRIEPEEGYSQYVTTDQANVEKVEPSVEVFGPGDVVRSKSSPSFIYMIGSDGYYLNKFGSRHKIQEDFTSKHYERVEVG